MGVSAPQIALLQIRCSLVPDGTGIRLLCASLTLTARLPTSGLPASLACGVRTEEAVALSISYMEAVSQKSMASKLNRIGNAERPFNHFLNSLAILSLRSLVLINFVLNPKVEYMKSPRMRSLLSSVTK